MSTASCLPRTDTSEIRYEHSLSPEFILLAVCSEISSKHGLLVPPQSDTRTLDPEVISPTRRFRGVFMHAHAPSLLMSDADIIPLHARFLAASGASAPRQLLRLALARRPRKRNADVSRKKCARAGCVSPRVGAASRCSTERGDQNEGGTIGEKSVGQHCCARRQQRAGRMSSQADVSSTHRVTRQRTGGGSV
eukprot:568868-Rhodomonas_salina.2